MSAEPHLERVMACSIVARRCSVAILRSKRQCTLVYPNSFPMSRIMSDTGEPRRQRAPACLVSNAQPASGTHLEVDHIQCWKVLGRGKLPERQERRTEAAGPGERRTGLEEERRTRGRRLLDLPERLPSY